MIRVQVSCLPIIGDKVVVIKKDDLKSSTHGMWIPAGGHVEEGETLEEACIREVQEETGLTISHPKVKGIVTFISDTGYHSVCTFFSSEDVSGDIMISEEHIEVEWKSRQELLSGRQVTFYHEYIYRKILVEHKFFNIVLRFTGNNPVPELIENN